MSKGLEALDKLVNHINLLNHINGVERQEVFEPLVNKNKSIIEKELKEYESYRSFLDNVEKGAITYTPRDTWEEERKKLKALKIIVKKANIRPFEMNDRYYFKTTNNLYEISKEKYDLLKEVFNK